MKDEKETKRKLLESAKAEFLEKGYMQASLRNICKNAGVTTGALYFFFQDKEDLFASLVEEPTRQLYAIVERHYADERNHMDEKQTDKDFSDDLKVSRQIIQYLYEQKDAFLLLLTKSQGSRYQGILDYFVDITEKHYQEIIREYACRAGVEPPDDYMIHWISHMQIDIFAHMLTHEPSGEAAFQHMDDIIKYLMYGWYGFFIQNENMS